MSTQAYIGQMGQTFETRFKEHARDIKNNGPYSKIGQHIIDSGHECDAMEKAMGTLHIEKKK